MSYAEAMAPAPPEGGWELRITVAALLVTLAVHALVALAFSRFDEEVVPVEGTIKRSATLCVGGRRCPAIGWHRPRADIDEGPSPELDIIQAAVIPRLGMLEQDPEKLPKLQKYEQPEIIEEAVNITEEPPPEAEPLQFQAPKPRPEQRDKKVRKPRSLTSILGEPDDDPRKRATDLSRIVGQRTGSVYGTGAAFEEGNEWAGRVQLAFRKEFAVPASIEERELRKLKTQILIQRITPAGEILAFEVKERSTSAAYDTACVQLIKMFMPKEGGALKLPEPPREVIDYVNRNGLLVELEGRLFRR